jgi:acetate kinase
VAIGEGVGPVLAVNVGSSSLKLSVLDPAEALLVAAEHDFDGDEGELEAAFEAILETAPTIAAVGHRVVHGGDAFTEPVLIDAETEAALDRLGDLAPLHNPPALKAIEVLRRLRPDLPAVACFDTSFHTTIPAAASTYAIPAAWSGEIPLRRYGFHGLSHAYAGRRAAELLGRAPEELRLVSAHLGAGASLAAVSGGRSVETTMGFTPLDGLVMATRSGSIDPGLLLWVQRDSDRGPDQIERELDREAGLLALSGHADMREVLAGADAGDEPCRLALDVYLHRLVAGVAAMSAAMGGLDALVFTGGVGERSPQVRAACSGSLAFLGVSLDAERNAEAGDDALLSSAGAAAPVVLVKAREDIEIARQVRAVLVSA